MKINLKKKIPSHDFILFHDAKKNLSIEKELADSLDAAILDEIKNYIHSKKFDSSTLHQKFITSQFNDVILVNLTELKSQRNALKLGAKLYKETIEKSKLSYSLLLPKEQKNMIHFIEGVYLASYEFGFYKNIEDKKAESKKSSVTIVHADEKLNDELKQLQFKLDGVLLARNSGNHPGNVFTPTQFKVEAEKIAKTHKLKISVLDDKEIHKLKMGCFSAVAQGTVEPSYIITLEYCTKEKNADTILVVGKGLTFDTGGISIKPSASMEEMKFDMCGGAAVLGLMKSVAQIKPDVNVVAMIGTTENMPGGKAIKPGDIVQAYNKKFVEIINTDAEGRLVLADTLSYGIEKHKPDAVINFATLTGACVVALGKHNAGLFSNSKKLTDQLTKSGLDVGEQVWSMPMDDEYNEAIKGVYSDLKNVGDRYGGSITAAKFLEHFVGETPWAHIDIAGTAWHVPRTEYFPEKGATGFGVRLMVDFLMNWKSSKK